MKFIKIILMLTTFILSPALTVFSQDSTITASEYQQYLQQSQDLRKADGELSSAYRELMSSSMSQEEKDQLKAEQRRWIKERDARAAKEGTKGSGVYIDALTILTNDRISKLETKLDSAKETSASQSMPASSAQDDIKPSDSGANDTLKKRKRTEQDRLKQEKTREVDGSSSILLSFAALVFSILLVIAIVFAVHQRRKRRQLNKMKNSLISKYGDAVKAVIDGYGERISEKGLNYIDALCNKHGAEIFIKIIKGDLWQGITADQMEDFLKERYGVNAGTRIFQKYGLKLKQEELDLIDSVGENNAYKFIGLVDAFGSADQDDHKFKLKFLSQEKNDQDEKNVRTIFLRYINNTLEYIIKHDQEKIDYLYAFFSRLAKIDKLRSKNALEIICRFFKPEILLLFANKLGESGTDRLFYLMDKYEIVDGTAVKIIAQEKWEGMTVEQLIDSMGKPNDIKDGFHNTKTFYYGRETGPRGGITYKLTVKLKNDIVTDWKENE